MTIDELIEKLEALDPDYAGAAAHDDADALLLDFIDNDRVRQLHDDLPQWEE